MQAWLAVIGTLAGAVVAGVISIVLMILSNKHALKVAKLKLAEDRAQWAAERQLEQLRGFYGNLERLVGAVEQFRIQQAWDADLFGDGVPAPDWVPTYNTARGEFEDALRATGTQTSLLDEGVQAEYERVRGHYLKWLCSKTKEAGVNEILDMEKDLHAFRRWLAKCHQDIFDKRRSGRDVVR